MIMLENSIIPYQCFRLYDLKYLQVPGKNSPEVAEEKIAALLKGNLNEKSEGRGYKAMTKRYDYLFTGLNDKVLRFDIKYNNLFFLALHSYRSVFAGLDETTKAKN